MVNLHSINMKLDTELLDAVQNILHYSNILSYKGGQIDLLFLFEL